MLIEGTGVVGVEIVLYQSDLDRVWILGGKCLAKQRVRSFGALWVYLRQALASQRFDCRQQRTRAKLFILVVLFSWLAWLHRCRNEGVADQKAGPFVIADYRIVRVIRQRIECQNALHLGQKGRSEGAKAPGLLYMWLQLVFFRIVPTIVCEIVSQKPASTTFSARRRKVQRSWPSGASLHANAVTLAR